MTSNHNEAIHSILFQMVRKTEAVGMDTMKLGAALAVIRYNDGFAGVKRVFEMLGVNRLLPKCNDRNKILKRPFSLGKLTNFTRKLANFGTFLKCVVNFSNSSQQYSVNGKAKAKPLL